jgi:hypothetical protein
MSLGMRQLNGVYTKRFIALHASCGHVCLRLFQAKTSINPPDYQNTAIAAACANGGCCRRPLLVE